MESFCQTVAGPVVCHNQTVAFAPHLHNAVEIIVLFEGKAVLAANGRDYPLAGGDCVLVCPGVIHSYTDNGAVEAGKFIFPAGSFAPLQRAVTEKEICLLNRDEAGEVRALARQVIGLSKKGDPLSLQSALLLLAGMMLDRGHWQASYDTSPLMTRLVSYCQSHYTGPLTLPEVAGYLHVSTGYLSHLLSRRLHMTFPAYVQQLRVGRATELLDTDLSMTEIADACGFSGLRSFDRAFSVHKGCSPSAWRKKNQEEQDR